MDTPDQIIENLRQKLEKVHAENVRLSGQLEWALYEKVKCEKKLKVQRDDFIRDLDKLKRMHETQETKLRQEIKSMNERKNEFVDQFKLMKSEEAVHVAAIGVLKRKFEQKLDEYSIENVLESDDLFASQQTAPTRNTQVVGTTSYAKEQVNVDELKVVTSCIQEHNRYQVMETVIPSRAQAVERRLSMRKISETIIKPPTPARETRAKSIETRNHTPVPARVTRAKSTENRRLVEMRRPLDRLPPQAIVDRRHKRTLRCTLCSKPYMSSPTQALCSCQYEYGL